MQINTKFDVGQMVWLKGAERLVQVLSIRIGQSGGPVYEVEWLVEGDTPGTMVGATTNVSESSLDAAPVVVEV